MQISRRLLRNLPKLILPQTHISSRYVQKISRNKVILFSNSEKGNEGKKQNNNSNSGQGNQNNNNEPDGWKKRYEEFVKQLNIVVSNFYNMKFSPFKFFAISTLCWLLYKAFEVKPLEITSS